MSRLRSPVVVAALATFLVRAWVASARMDELELELYSGSMAKAWLAGMPTDLAQLPVIPHNRGSVVLGALLVPLFAVLGPTLAAIKLLAIAISAATAAGLAWIADRSLGRTAAWCTALLVALLPPTYQMVDVLALGSHTESVLLTLVAAACVLAPEGGPRSPGRMLAAGLALGFAVFFSLQCLVAIPALLVAWLARDPRFFRRPSFLLYLTGAGLWIPLARLFLEPERAAVIDGQSATQRFLPDGLGGALEKLGRTLTHDLPASLGFGAHGVAALGWIWYAAFLLGGLAIARRAARRDAWSVFLLLYPPLVLAAYAASNFQFKLVENLDGMGSRFVAPLVAVGGVWIAAACRSVGALDPRAAIGAAALLGGVGAWGLGALVTANGAYDQPMVRGTELAFFHGHVEHASEGDLAARLDWVERIEPDWPEDRPLLYPFFDVWDEPIEGAGQVDTALAAIRAEREELRPFLWTQLGREASLGMAPEEVASLALDSEEATRWFFRGVGNQMFQHLLAWFGRNRAGDPDGTATLARYFAELAKLEAPRRRAAVDGLGFTLGSRITPYQPILLAVLRGNPSIPLEDRPAFFGALGRGYRTRFREATYETPGRLRIEAGLEPNDRAFLRGGLERSVD